MEMNMIKPALPLDENRIVTQEIALGGDDNDYIAYSVCKLVTGDAYTHSKWTTSQWMKLNTFVLTGNDVQYMLQLIIYLKHGNYCYRYAFIASGAPTYNLRIAKGQENPNVTLNGMGPSRRDKLLRYDPYIVCCGCCDTIYALDDIEESQDPNRDCVIS
jgi:hypothetical protein